LSKALQGNVKSVPLPGTADLLSSLSKLATLGIATANLKAAAELRLAQAGLWSFVSSHAQGADGGGHKSVILGRLLDRLNIAPSRVIFIGDNLNDVEAGLQNGVHFIAFSMFAKRRLQLQNHGARLTSANHSDTLKIVNALMA
jgi:phosphoglycolate phosphatase-like HAD superfamily hydrolase